MNDVELNQVVVRFGGDDGRRSADPPDHRPHPGRRRLLRRRRAVEADATRWVMRISVIGEATTEADVDRSADAMISAWRAVQAEGT